MIASNDAALRGLYPFLHGKAQEPGRLDAALLHSVAAKAAGSRDTNARFFGGEQGEAVVAAASSGCIWPGGISFHPALRVR